MFADMFKRICLISLTTICIAAVVGWGTSYSWWVQIGVGLPDPWSHVTLHQVRGHVQLNVYRAYFRFGDHTGVTIENIDELERQWAFAVDLTDTFHPPPFILDHNEAKGVSNNTLSEWYSLGMPHWFIAVLSAAWPTFALCRWALARRAGVTCTRCGYDLRGSMEQQRCPECGEPITSTTGDDS